MAYYDQIAAAYDSTRRADPYIVGRLIHHLGLNPLARYLDVGCGTGNYTVALATHGGSWHGVDRSPRMIAAAHRKSQALRWAIADAADLPYKSGTFSGAICTLAIHNFSSLAASFRSSHRVLSAGPLVILTSTKEQVRRYWLQEYFPEAMRTVADQMPSRHSILAALQAAGFATVATEPYLIRADLQDLFLYSGKHRPELYLDPAVRAQISGLSRWADRSEIEEGCQRLRTDIGTGRIAELQHKFEDGEGDYLFVIARKG